MNVRVVCHLSKRQRELLQQIVAGDTIKSIALTMHVSQKTVEYHYKKLREKLNMWTVPELTKFALYLGITEPYMPELWKEELR